MTKTGLILLLTLIITRPLWGQSSYPKFELFGGYSFSHETIDSIGFNMNGWGAAFTGNITKNIGLTADFSGAYGSEAFSVCPVASSFTCAEGNASLSTYHFLAGPRFTLHAHRASPFAEVLFGAAKTPGTSTFAMGFGGGVDVPLGKHLAYRLIQVDYLPTKRASGIAGWDSDTRVQTGIVFTFGGMKR